MKTSDVVKLISSVGAAFLAGLLGSIFTTPALAEWYPALRKPDWTPPDSVFGPVWGVLYLMMGVSAFIVWKQGGQQKDVSVALIVFAGQLVLNFLWSFVFFGMQETGLAFIVIVGLWFMILFTILLFDRVSRLAALLLMPYLLWTLFAAALNVVIFVSN